MDGRAGAVALNVRHILHVSPLRGSSPAPVPEDGWHATLISTPRSDAISIDSDSARGTSSAALDEVPSRACVASKEQLRERLVMAEARVAAAASSTARAQHMAAHLRDMLSPQATRTNRRVSSPSDI
jgi:hypothetical protein